MIGIWGSYSTHYLYVLSIGIIAGFGLPMLLAPITFARVLRWQIPEHEHLAIYFGRCLGGLACVIAAFGLKVAGVTALQPFFFQLAIGAFCILTLVHIYGGLRKIQPISETLEIIFWFGLIVLTLCFYPG
jgi:hypothetical protein